jgi:excisionase family DNA binding protein
MVTVWTHPTNGLTIDRARLLPKVEPGPKLYGMAQRGELPASKIGNQWRFNREEIDQWMKSNASGKAGSDT